MKQLKQLINQLWSWTVKHWRLLILVGVIGLVVILTSVPICYYLVSPAKQFVLGSSSDIPKQQVTTGLVLGAGIRGDGKPFKELKARLDVAADALDKRYINKLILSGDNRFDYYNEPAAMRRYLINDRHISADKLTVDYAGRSTYESCERAKRVFGQNKLVIFSAPSHLPRAIYLCRHFDIEAYGVSSGLDANNSWRRELMARVKAVINIYVVGEKTVLGPPIKI